MLYYLGLSRLNREERIALAAQLNILTGFNLLSDCFRKSTAKVKNGLMGGLAGLLDRQGQSAYARRVREAERKLDWNTEILSQSLDEETRRLSALPDPGLIDELRGGLRKLSGQDGAAPDSSVARSILERAARSLGMDPTVYVDEEQLEVMVFEKSVQKQYEELKKRLQDLSPQQTEKLAEVLEQELGRFSQSEREAVKNFLGTEQLSGKAMLSLLRTLSGVAVAKLVFAGTGIGAFLFLTTVMKATAMLMGVTLSFGTYAAATSLLAVLASGPVLALVAGLSGGFILHRTSRQVEDQLAQLAVMTGHWRMSESH